jgi:hypothetical protein
MDRGVPTEEVLAEMRAADPPMPIFAAISAFVYPPSTIISEALAVQGRGRDRSR